MLNVVSVSGESPQPSTIPGCGVLKVCNCVQFSANLCFKTKRKLSFVPVCEGEKVMKTCRRHRCRILARRSNCGSSFHSHEYSLVLRLHVVAFGVLAYKNV